MRIFDGTVCRDMTAEEIEALEKGEQDYWANISYDEAVDIEFRKDYPQRRVEAIVNNFLSDMTNPLFIQEMQEMQKRRAQVKVYVKEKYAKYGIAI